MRVKTVPRQRVLQCNKDTAAESETVTVKSNESEQLSSSSCEGEEMAKDGKDALRGSDESTVDLNMNPVEGHSMKENEEKEVSNYPDEALDMSIKPKVESPKESSTLLTLLAGPSCQYDSHSEEDTEDSSNDENNNVPSYLTTNLLTSNRQPDVSKQIVIFQSLLQKFDSEDCLVAGSSSNENSKLCVKKLCSSSDSDEDKPVEAVNLCKKDCQEEDLSHASGGSDERLKDTFLYKIMTDPMFLENIQKHKQSKRYMCQFCKQKFSNSDELADHMDPKKDETNQVVCCACKKTFAQKRYLRYHQRCHSDRTMFTCDICTKKYTRLDNLSRHNAFHVNPDKFSCTYCEKTFARKDLYNKHLKCHDNKYRFFCEVCQRYFKGPLTLDNHKRNVHATG